MKLLDEWKYEASEWAYFQCKNGNDTEEIRRLITHPYWAYILQRYKRYRRNVV